PHGAFAATAAAAAGSVLGASAAAWTGLALRSDALPSSTPFVCGVLLIAAGGGGSGDGALLPARLPWREPGRDVGGEVEPAAGADRVAPLFELAFLRSLRPSLLALSIASWCALLTVANSVSRSLLALAAPQPVLASDCRCWCVYSGC